MKRNVKHWVVILICLATLWVACDETKNEDPLPEEEEEIIDDNEDDEDPSENKEDSTDFNVLASCLVFENVSTIQGNIPASSDLSDLKINKGKIHLAQNYQNRIQILYPDKKDEGNTIYIQVEGTETHYALQPVEEEGTDTTDVFYMGFDPCSENLPAKFNISIGVGNSGSIIDDFDREVTIDNGDPIGDDSDDEDDEEDEGKPAFPAGDWNWVWTKVQGQLNLAPGFPSGVHTQVNGCCMDGYSVDCIANAIPESEWIPLDYYSYFVVYKEVLSLKENGEMTGIMVEGTQNIDPSESDFCSRTATYINRQKQNNFWGNFTYNPTTNKLSFHDLDAEQEQIYLEELDFWAIDYHRFFISPMAEYEFLSDDLLIERSSLEGQSTERLFERVTEIDDSGQPIEWHD